MESAHTNPPILIGSFHLIPSQSQGNSDAVDTSDPSFLLDTSQQKLTSDDWDASELDKGVSKTKPPPAVESSAPPPQARRVTMPPPDDGAPVIQLRSRASAESGGARPSSRRSVIKSFRQSVRSVRFDDELHGIAKMADEVRMAMDAYGQAVRTQNDLKEKYAMCCEETKRAVQLCEDAEKKEGETRAARQKQQEVVREAEKALDAKKQLAAEHRRKTIRGTAGAQSADEEARTKELKDLEQTLKEARARAEELEVEENGHSRFMLDGAAELQKNRRVEAALKVQLDSQETIVEMAKQRWEIAQREEQEFALEEEDEDIIEIKPAARITACFEYAYPDDETLPPVARGSQFRHSPLLFPIFATLLEIDMFNTLEESEFTSCLTLFAERFAVHVGKLTAPHAVVLLLSLAKLAQHRPLLSPERVDAFVKALGPVVRATVNELFDSMNLQIRKLAQTLASAKFHVESLIEDCKTMFKRGVDGLKFSPGINRFLSNCLLVEFQNLAVTGIIENPEKFTFGNSMLWNSAVTGVQSEVNVELKFLKELVVALNMAEEIARRPSDTRAICPTLPLECICFVLHRYVIDVHVTRPLDMVEFMKHFQITQKPVTMSLPRQEFKGFDNIDDIDLTHWNSPRLAPAVKRTFRYLEHHLKK